MKLIIGLGNPGKSYTKTRHNIGWLVLDKLADKDKWSESKKGKLLHLHQTRDNHEIELIKPLTFMNNSGQAIAYALKKHNLTASDIIVVHDDKDLILGKIKVQTGASSAGHNGVKSIIEHLKTKDFTRVRIGVASDNSRKMADTSKFVLNKFSLLEKSKLNEALKQAVEQIINLLNTK